MGQYSFFSHLWTGSKKYAVSHWMIMAIALVPLLLVQQVANGMIEGIARRIIETNSYHFLFVPNKTIDLSKKAVRDVYTQKIQSVEGINGAFPEVKGIGIVRKNANKTGISIRGVSGSLLQDASFNTYLRIIEGVATLEHKDDVLLGKAIAESLGASVGDVLLVLTTNADTKQAVLPKISRVKVAGIISTGYEEMDKTWMLTSIKKASTLIPKKEQTWYIGMKIDDPFSIPNELLQRSKKATKYARDVQARVKNEVLKAGYVANWYSANYNQFSLFSDTKNMLSLVMFIAVILAAVTLSSTMSMKVVDMEIDIAMLKGIGAHPKKLERQIFLQGLRYGIIGAFFGASIATLLTFQVNTIIFIIDGIINVFRYVFGYTNPISILNPEYYLTKIPFHFYPKDMLFVVVSAIVLTVIAAWIPARKLRKISALKIIRRH